MKNKSLLVIFIFIALATANSYAQSSSDGVSLRIRFLPVQTISVNPSQEVVELLYDNVEDYENGVTAEYNDHLTVFSVGGFQVNVSANGVNFEEQSSERTLPLSDMVVRATNGSGNSLIHEFNNVALSTTQNTLIASEKGGRDLHYNVTYDNSVAGSDGIYRENYSTSGNTESVFGVEITYTITSDWFFCLLLDSNFHNNTFNSKYGQYAILNRLHSTIFQDAN